MFVRFTLDRSYFLSRLSAPTPSFARSFAFLPPSLPLSPPRPARRTLRAPFPPCPSPLSPTSGVSVVLRLPATSAEGRGPETRGRGHVDSLRSLARSLARSPRLGIASLRFACGASSSSAAWRGTARRSVLLLLLLLSSSALSLDVAALLIVRAARPAACARARCDFSPRKIA